MAIIPADLVFENSNYRPEMQDFPVPHGTYVHICGIDIIRDEHGDFRVLEDNARTPSGVSYVIENRHLMLRTFPDLMAGIKLMPVDDYGRRLRAAMAEIARRAGSGDPQVVLLSPGIYNSAYFEHVFLAREMGVPLVVGADLVVEDDRVYMRTTAGLKPVHTIYRRLNDDFLDPKVFRPNSMLGVPGLIGAWKAGNVAIANAVGTGVADDKAVYAYMPRIIKYYLGEEPLIKNVDTHICREAEGLKYTLDNLDKLVTKPVGRIRRLWHHHRPARQQGGAGGLARRHPRRSVQLDQPADDRAVGRADPGRGGHRPAPSGPAALHHHRQGELGAARRALARGHEARLADRQFIARRRL